jgi:hypothetical protein
MKKGNSKTYLYLIIVLLLGLLLAGFIQPLLEGFKEGSENPPIEKNMCPDKSWTYDKTKNVCSHDVLKDDTCPPNPTVNGKTFELTLDKNTRQCYYRRS